jgi:hypothetical protein
LGRRDVVPKVNGDGRRWLTLLVCWSRVYPATMEVAGRRLSPAVLKALTHWPGVGRKGREPVDLAVLLPLFNDLLGELPWWNRTWRVTQVEPAYPCEVASDGLRSKNRFTEVSVPGTLSSDAEQELPFFARIRLEEDRLLRFQAKIADMVIGPALGESGVREPHPFGAVLSALMANRSVSVRRLARQILRSEATIHVARAGSYNPHPVLVWEIAQALEIPAADLAAIAGVEEAPAGTLLPPPALTLTRTVVRRRPVHDPTGEQPETGKKATIADSDQDR